MTNLPVSGPFKVTCEYHKRGANWAAGHHTGIDLVSYNRLVYGTCDGVVHNVGFDKHYGNYIVVYNSNDDTYHWFCHLASSKVKIGDKINRTRVIGVMGSTGKSSGVHLHFEIRLSCNKYDKTSNPAAYMGIPNECGFYNSINFSINNKKTKISDTVYLPCRDTMARNTQAHAALIEIDSDMPFTGTCTKQIWVFESTLSLDSKTNSYNKVKGKVAHDSGDRFIIDLDVLDDSVYDKQIWVSKASIE